MQHIFDATGPVTLDVGIRSGNVRVESGPDDRAEVDVTVAPDRSEDDVQVSFDRGVLVVHENTPARLWAQTSPVTVVVALPAGSQVRVRTASADIAVSGRFAETTLAAGSGAIVVERLDAASHLRTGSGAIHANLVAADLTVGSGSGDVRLDEVRDSVRVKVGSGNTRVRAAFGDLAVSAGSGSLRVDEMHEGELRVRTGSGDVTLGVAPSVPVWTDITARGGIANRLTPRGAPAQGQACVRVRGILGSGRLELADA